jgi:type I restriction-modification system DNA methylase subunit
VLTPHSIKGLLRECGYRPDLLRADFAFGENQSAPLVAFAQQPADSRSACVAVLAEPHSPWLAVEACKPLGTPIVFVCSQNSLQWWKQGSNAAEHLQNVQANEVQSFFRKNQDQFSPEAVYRAKTWGRFQAEYQLSFVDLGLMPVVEEQVGNALGELIERNVSDLKHRLGWDAVSSEQGQWLLQSVFWLLSGKILRDKQVESFGNLDLGDVDTVFRRVGKHYGTLPLTSGSKKKLEALTEAAYSIDRFSSLALTTTEALAYVYENTLISKETRSALGTHSTPSFLVDYVVGNLAEWVNEIPVNERSVFEPACGHAAFLVSAMRLLTDILPADKAVPSRRGPYLRSRLHGSDIDPFALELARLSLTLTDIPNPDGWDLKAENVFLGDRLATQAKKNTILLANPPFDNFTPQDKLDYSEIAVELTFTNKAAEMLWRTLPQLPEGGVFGVVVPQTILHSDNAAGLRKMLVEEFELREICLFPDKVFSFSDAESAVIIGRRRPGGGNTNVRYRRVREHQLTSFRADPSLFGVRTVPKSRFSDRESYSLALPDLEEVWIALRKLPTLGAVCSTGQGLFFRGRDLPEGTTTYSEVPFPGGRSGFVRLDKALLLHELPRRFWMNLDSAAVDREVTGSTTGTPQVLLNYARASRGPWRLKALIDRQGHPVTSRFITVRPTASSISIEALWALLNGPIANAFAYSHLGKRDNIVGDIRRIPFPIRCASRELDRAVAAYWDAASSQTQPAELERLLRRVDAEGLKLYDLSLDLEQQILSLFTDWKRVGVPFTQNRYLPATIEGKLSLSQFLDMEDSWSATNRERGRLIDKNIAGTITAEERTRLDALQAYADYHLQMVSPRPTHLLDELERRLGDQGRRS